MMTLAAFKAGIEKRGECWFWKGPGDGDVGGVTGPWRGAWYITKGEALTLADSLTPTCGNLACIKPGHQVLNAPRARHPSLET